MMECVTRWEIKIGVRRHEERQGLSGENKTGEGGTRQLSIKKRQGRCGKRIVVMLQTCCY